MSFDLAIKIRLQSELTVIHTATYSLFGVLLRDFMIPFFVNHYNFSNGMHISYQHAGKYSISPECSVTRIGRLKCENFVGLSFGLSGSQIAEGI